MSCWFNMNWEMCHIHIFDISYGQLMGWLIYQYLPYKHILPDIVQSVLSTQISIRQM